MGYMGRVRVPAWVCYVHTYVYTPAHTHFFPRLMVHIHYAPFLSFLTHDGTVKSTQTLILTWDVISRATPLWVWK